MRISSGGKRKPPIRAALAAIGLTLGGLAAGGGAASAATPPSASSWPAQVDRPVAATCPAGETLAAPTGGWTDSLGVSHITYSSHPGMVDKIAPSGLTASRVTPELLADLGLSASGVSKAAYQAHVSQALSMARARTAPAFCYSPTPIAPPVQAKARPAKTRTSTASTASPRTAVSAASVNVIAYSSIWGGTAITEYQSGSGINGAEGQWVQPSAQFGGSDGYTVNEGTFVGVGSAGDLGAPVVGLIQAGTTMETGYGYRAFYEAIARGSGGCSGTTFCGGFSAANAVAPGQVISAFVYWENTTNACFYVATGTTTIFNVCSPVNIPYDHTSAEWVNENLQEFGEQYPDPSTVTFNYQSYSNDFGEVAGNSPFATPDFDLFIMGWGGNTSSGTPINCSNPTIMSYPTDGSTSGDLASSEVLTCPNPTEYEYPAT